MIILIDLLSHTDKRDRHIDIDTSSLKLTLAGNLLR